MACTIFKLCVHRNSFLMNSLQQMGSQVCVFVGITCCGNLSSLLCVILQHIKILAIFTDPVMLQVPMEAEHL